MMVEALVIFPAAAALAAFVIKKDRVRRWLLVGVGVVQALLVLAAGLGLSEGPTSSDWLALDAVGLLFLSIVSLLYLLAALYAVGYLRREESRLAEERSSAFTLLANSPEQSFSACLLLFLAAMTLAVVSQHMGLMWFAVEATTLVSAPLIYFHRTPTSLEAMWKYLLICSIGIALALLGTFFMAVAAGSRELLFSNLLSAPPAGTALGWLELSFIFLLVGYGTKTGLAPFHTWLPDAHSEAPSVISALLSGALLNCAMLAIVRAHTVCAAAGIGGFSSKLLIFFGLLSLLYATIFIVRQQDLKRLLAYSSVEHMGIIALGLGLGGVGAFGALLHALNHSLVKAMLFLVAGNIISVYRTKSVRSVSGLLHVLPVSGGLWVAGLLAVTGLPPFGLFISEFLIVKAAFDSGRIVAGGLFLVLLATIFVAMSHAVLGMAQGALPPASVLRGCASYRGEGRREPLLAVCSPLVLCAAVLGLGVCLPAWLREIIARAAGVLGGLV